MRRRFSFFSSRRAFHPQQKTWNLKIWPSVTWVISHRCWAGTSGMISGVRSRVARASSHAVRSMPLASVKSLRQDWSSELAVGMGERGGDMRALWTGVTGLRRMGDNDSEHAHFQDIPPRRGSSPNMTCITSPSCWLGKVVDTPGPAWPWGLGPGRRPSRLPLNSEMLGGTSFVATCAAWKGWAQEKMS